MKHNIPAPNPAVGAILVSPEMRSLMFERGEMAQALYREIVAKRTGRLARSARVETFIGGKKNDRWQTRLIVDAPYAASHEFGTDDGDEGITAGVHDLNVVLNALGQL